MIIALHRYLSGTFAAPNKTRATIVNAECSDRQIALNCTRLATFGGRDCSRQRQGRVMPAARHLRINRIKSARTEQTQPGGSLIQLETFKRCRRFRRFKRFRRFNRSAVSTVVMPDLHIYSLLY